MKLKASIEAKYRSHLTVDRLHTNDKRVPGSISVGNQRKRYFVLVLVCEVLKSVILTLSLFIAPYVMTIDITTVSYQYTPTYV